jgi:hypothetical protein
MERDLMAEAAATALPSNRVNRRLAFVRWVRRTHGWFGLWGALLGLMPARAASGSTIAAS